jgi:hypothetical protein
MIMLELLSVTFCVVLRVRVRVQLHSFSLLYFMNRIGQAAILYLEGVLLMSSYTPCGVALGVG